MVTCNEYDYIEIVCLFHYPIKMTLKGGHIVEGVALDTQRNDQNQECIKIKHEDGRSELVVLSELTKLAVGIENPHFAEVKFE